MAAGKTAKSILISLGVRLEKFNLPQIASVVAHDELNLPSLGEKKTALFALIPDNDSSLNFIIGMMYTQLFQELFLLADQKHGGRLPVHIHCMMDEFANVALPDEFDKLLSTMRSREVSVSIILQNIAQLKALYEKQWESIIGNCDEFVYLGGNEQSTHKYVSELLGKSTIDTNTYGKSTGRSGNYSTNTQVSGRELLHSKVMSLAAQIKRTGTRSAKHIQTDGGIEYGFRLCKMRRLSCTRIGTARERVSHRQIWVAAGTLSNGASEGRLQRHAA